jgi:hypothetical protein
MDNKRISTRKGRELEDDQELELFERQLTTPEEDNEDDLPAVTKEDETWRKRYSDLRSHAAKKENDLVKAREDDRKRIEALEGQLRTVVREQANLPKTADSQTVHKWIQDFPEVYGVVAAIIKDEITDSHEKTTKQLSEKVEAIERDRHELTKQQAMAAVLRVHPDLPKIVASDHYQNWLVEQEEKGRKGNSFSRALFEALWENETDADAAIEALNHYKAQKGKKSQKDIEAEALAPVARSNSTGPTEHGNKPVFKESQIDAMSYREYEKYEEAIENARRDGRIVYDITGAAR